ncbi:MAG: DUF5329 domain-containing protein [Burkholderiales bacterium]|jgi:hypothetical protein|uniref:DUF5329 domain-containing protein n=1 Tax=Limnobacter sp. TaxID=2003368 RepID=UPI00395A7319|nr:DUF5329 domain-containing protein [Burkholderiales bacterium]
MKHLLIASVAGFWCLVVTAAPTAAPVRAEIEALLNQLQVSGCQFNRNGSWYSGSEAKQHLLRKLEYIEGRGTIQSTEQFIELAASKSSFSGRAYLVKCAGQAPVASQVWLIQQLAVVRGVILPVSLNVISSYVSSQKIKVTFSHAFLGGSLAV